MPLVAKLLILAIAAQVLLTLAILILMGIERLPRIMSGEIRLKDIAVDTDAYPLKARLLSNNFDNQFQLPVLFYLAALLALWSGGTSWLEVSCAWAFVALRCAHTAIHITTNNVEHRFAVYATGLAVLAILWLLLLLRLLLS